MNILDVIRLQISVDEWIKNVSKKVNVSKKHEHPPFEKWDKDKIITFERICGLEMKMYGYEIPNSIGQ